MDFLFCKRLLERFDRRRKILYYLQFVRTIDGLVQSITILQGCGHLEWVNFCIGLLSQGRQLPQENSKRPLVTKEVDYYSGVTGIYYQRGTERKSYMFISTLSVHNMYTLYTSLENCVIACTLLTFSRFRDREAFSQILHQLKQPSPLGLCNTRYN